MKAMSTSQVEKLHGFEQNVVELKSKDNTLENVNEFKLLGITIDKIWQLETAPQHSAFYTTRGKGVMLFASIWPIVYGNRYVTHALPKLML